MFSVHSVNPGRAWYPFLFIASESVHVVSLQALKTPGQTTLGKTAITTKTTPGTFSFMKDLRLHGHLSFISYQSVKMSKKKTENRHELDDPAVYYLELDTVHLCMCFHTESVDYEAQDISVRVMSPQSVLVSWVHPALEMGKVDPQVARWESVKHVCLWLEGMHEKPLELHIFLFS